MGTSPLPRHATEHWGRAASAEERVYVLHSQACKDSTPDLRECAFSVALDNGIDEDVPWTPWSRAADRPVRLVVHPDGWLLPDTTEE